MPRRESSFASSATGLTGECGVIESVTAENFMCHRNFQLDFCPRINYITGVNGSGKSAVLAAIQICLGARATTTNRGLR